MKKILLGLMIIAARVATGQEFTIKQVELSGENIIIHYDLMDTTKNRFYTVHLFSSKDDFLNPLTKVSGDIGLEVRPGAASKITWDPKEFGATFKGDVELEVRGRVYVPFVKFTNLQDYKYIKRAKPTTLSWTGGTRQNILNFNLYKGEDLVTVIDNIANSGSYDISLPTSVKPGDGYYFLVTDSKNKDLVMKTSEFTVKRKVGLAYKIIPILLVGGIVYQLLPQAAPSPLEGPVGPPADKN